MYVKQYPLVLACGFVNHSGRVSYKQEYIIPQMLMHGFREIEIRYKEYRILLALI
jgi:hypothetical protein